MNRPQWIEARPSHGFPDPVLSFDHPPTVYEIESAIKRKYPGATYGTPAGNDLGVYHVSVFGAKLPCATCERKLTKERK
jgi:hypothetical protein